VSNEIVYAKSGGPPDNWHGIRVFDEAGNEIKDVEEVHAGEGWLIRAKRNAQGHIYAEGDEIAKERIEGKFRLVLPEEQA
jgi:hypothetical protein